MGLVLFFVFVVVVWLFRFFLGEIVCLFVSQYYVCDVVLPEGVAVLLLNYSCTFPVAIKAIWLCCTSDL